MFLFVQSVHTWPNDGRVHVLPVPAVPIPVLGYFRYYKPLDPSLWVR